MALPLQQPCFYGGEYRQHHLRHLGTSLYDGLWLYLPCPQNETRGAESIKKYCSKRYNGDRDATLSPLYLFGFFPVARGKEVIAIGQGEHRYIFLIV